MICPCQQAEDIKPEVPENFCTLRLNIKDTPENNFGLLPLPNLDFKLVCANTLIAVPEVQSTGSIQFIDEFVEKNPGEGQYILSGRLEIDYLNEKYALNLPESEEYDTLAGYLIYQYQHIFI